MIFADHVGLYCGGNILRYRPKVGVFPDDVFTLQSFCRRKIVWFRPEGLLYPAALDADKNEHGKAKKGKGHEYRSGIHAVPSFL